MLPQNNIFRNYRLLQTLLKDGGVFTCFDTETTGLHPEENNVIEIGAVKFDIDGVLDRFEVLINPGYSIPEKVTKVNHITDEMVSSCPVIADVLPDFLKFIGNSYLIAHNANFDLNFVNAELIRNSMKPMANKTIDTLDLARWAYPQLGKYNLQFLAQKFAINVENAHRADDDARVCMEFFIKCLNNISQKFH